MNRDTLVRWLLMFAMASVLIASQGASQGVGSLQAQDTADLLSPVQLGTSPDHYRLQPQVLNGGGGFESARIVPPSEAITPAYEGFTSVGGGEYLLQEYAACDCDVTYESKCGAPFRACPDYFGGRIYGWLDLGFTINDRSPPSHYNGPQGLNDRDEFQFNQIYLAWERPVDRSGDAWSFGGRFDLLFGSDYVVTEQVGWERTTAGAPKWNNHRHYGLSTPQAYVEAAHGGFSLRAGRFYSLLGYESVMAPENFFYSHSYAFTHGTPFTHTGMLMSLACNDWFSLSGGLINGWDRFDGVTDPVGFIGGFRAAPRKANYTFSGSVVADDDLAPISGQRDTRVVFSMLLTIDCNENIQVALAHDLGTHSNGGGGGLDAEWYGLTQYTYFVLTDTWAAGARFDWFRDDDGSRVRGVRADNPVGLGLVGHFYSASLGANWTPNANCRVRPEIRWDWFDGAGMPYDDGTQEDQFTFAVDAVLRF